MPSTVRVPSMEHTSQPTDDLLYRNSNLNSNRNSHPNGDRNSHLNSHLNGDRNSNQNTNPNGDRSSDQAAEPSINRAEFHERMARKREFLLKLKSDTNKNDLKEFVSGWSAAFVNILITFPINKVMFRQMAYGVKAKSAVSQFKGENLLYIYRGMVPPLISKTISVSIMFGTYHKYQEMFAKSRTMNNQSLNKTVSAILAGCTEAILTPFERVQMLLQHRAYDNTFNNTMHAFLGLRKYGFREYYRGLTPILLRNGPSNVVYFSSRDLVKSHFPQSPYWYVNLLQDFTSGALIGAMTSTIFYPLNAVRTKMQISMPGSGPLSIGQAFRTLYNERDRRFRNFYYGVHINFTRSLLSWGIITCVFEFTMKQLSDQ